MLKIRLKPFERLIINGAAIRNGDRAASLLIETECRFLRESELIKEDEVDTPCKQIQFLLQVLYLSEEKADLENQFFALSTAVLTRMPESVALMLELKDSVEDAQYHRAIKFARELVRLEGELGRRSAAAA
jgi:flagellar protein FlbT